MHPNITPDPELVDKVSREFKIKYVRQPDAVKHFVVHAMIENWHHVLHLQREEINRAITGDGLNTLIYDMIEDCMKTTATRRCPNVSVT